MINIYEYKTKNFKIAARESRGTMWFNIEFEGSEITLFFDDQGDFDTALRAVQSCSPPEDSSHYKFSQPSEGDPHRRSQERPPIPSSPSRRKELKND